VSQSVSVDLLKRILERLPGATFCARRELATGVTRWLYLSGKGAELFDVPEDDLLAEPGEMMKMVHPEDRPELDALIAHCVQTQAPMDHQFRLKCRNGAIRWLEVHATVALTDDGALLWYGQTVDVTARKELEQALADSEAAKARSEALYRQVINALPVGVTVADKDRKSIVRNPVMRRLTEGFDPYGGGEGPRPYGVFKEDGVTPQTREESGMARPLRGETFEKEVIVRNPNLDGDVHMHAYFCPVLDERGEVRAGVGVCQDVTLQRRLEAELRARNKELSASEAAKAELIVRLRHSIDELSNPILEVWDDVLVLPVIGVVDSQRTAGMVQRLLAEVTRSQARFVIIDLTGVDVVDTKTADHLMKLMRKVEVVGARCVLTGIRAAVAETLVDIGVDFGQLTTLRNLKHGLREALRHARREREGALEPDLDGHPEPAPNRRAR
jgi:rsbT co-antagonist protein RsbR